MTKRQIYLLEYKNTHKDEAKLYQKQYRQEHKEELKIKAKLYQKENQIELSNYQKEYHKKYYLKHKIEISEYRLKNKIKIANQREHNRKMRYKTDINFKILMILRARLNSALKGNPKLSTTIKLLGCSIDQLKQHLENQFKSGMSWDNYGKYGWHIDHIKPCASFDLSNPEEQITCFHYTNLQPLWAAENLTKSSKII